jgi:hypothetical protein
VKWDEAGGDDGCGAGHAMVPPRAQNRQNEHLGCLFYRFYASEARSAETVGQVEGGGGDDSDGTIVPPHAQKPTK